MRLKKGFTLVELLLAAAILAFVLSGMLLLFTNCFVLNGTSRNLSIATSHANYIMEEIRANGFTGLGAKITSNNGTPAGWDFNAAQLQASPYNLVPLANESIATSILSGSPGDDPLEVSVAVNWQDRGAKNRSVELTTRITNYR